MGEEQHRLAERLDRIEQHLSLLATVQAGFGSNLRTQHVEVVDDEGQVRLELGLLGPAVTSDEEVWGVVIKNDRGRDRVWMATVGNQHCASIELDYGGNAVASLSVSDAGEADLVLGEEHWPGSAHGSATAD